MAKGSQFERDMCREWSYWASNRKADDWFWRTPSSGGRATERVKKGLNARDYAGDMMAVNPKGRRLTNNCHFEFKIGYSKKNSKQKISITSIVDALHWEKVPIVVTWWQKLVSESKDHNKKIPLLVFKRDRKNACIVMDSKTWLTRCKFDRLSMPTKYAIIRHNTLYLVILPLEDFFSRTQPKWFYSEKPKIKLKRRRKK